MEKKLVEMCNGHEYLTYESWVFGRHNAKIMAIWKTNQHIYRVWQKIESRVFLAITFNSNMILIFGPKFAYKKVNVHIHLQSSLVKLSIFSITKYKLFYLDLNYWHI